MSNCREDEEPSADMRLLELRREKLGIPARTIAAAAYVDPDAFTGLVKKNPEAVMRSGPILIATMDARPRSGLIPGALITVSLSVSNEGDVAARSVRLALPLPIDTLYRAGTLTVDGVEGSEELVNDLFGNGAKLSDIEPGDRRGIVLKLVIESGLGTIVLSPHVRALSGGAVLGLAAMRLRRKTPSAPKIVAERPFYEVDDAEDLSEPLASLAALAPQPAYAGELHEPHFATPVTPQRANTPVVEATVLTVSSVSAIVEAAAQFVPPLSPSLLSGGQSLAVTIAQVQPADTIVVLESAPKAKGRASKSRPKTEAETPAQHAAAAVLEPVPKTKIEVVRSTVETVAFDAQGGPVLALRIDRKRLATLTSLFSGASLGMIAHYLVLNALAARDPLPGDGTDGSIAAFISDQEQLLSRALIATRLGKPPEPDSLGAALPPFPPAFVQRSGQHTTEPAPPGEAILFRAFAPSEVGFVARMISNENAAPFMRAAQLFVGLCANDVAIADERRRQTVAGALAEYAAQATAEISRIFLRGKLSRPALFKATDPAFDDAAKHVLAALAAAIA